MNPDISDHEASGGGGSGIAIRYLGQCGFLLQHRELSIAIDPYLSDSVDRLPDFPPGFWTRAYPPPVKPAALSQLNLVLCTHDHLDHTDPTTLCAIAQASPQCHFAAPWAAVKEMARAGISPDRTTALRAGHPFRYGSLLVTPVAAAHEDYEVDDAGNDRWLSYILQWAGATLFHAGDTVSTPQLIETLSSYTIDIGLLPINGGDAARRELGIVGNMDVPEAVALATRLRFRLVVPTHYDLYPSNGAALADFVAAWEATPLATRPAFKAFRPGEQIIYRQEDGRIPWTKECERPLSVIIGAGKTGRGFLARLLEKSGDRIAFIDRSKELVDRLNQDGTYAIHFFGGTRTPHREQHIPAAAAGSAEALNWLAEARTVFTAVGESNIADLAPDLAIALDRRRRGTIVSCGSLFPPLCVITCENGASPAAPLREAFAGRDTEIEIGEAAIFCSTIELPGTRLDIQSEAYDELPYDAERLPHFQPFPGMRAVPGFSILLKRKIYTYNCFSACIAYLGAYKGYQWYAEAATDPDINAILERVATPLNEAISQEFDVPLEEQTAFSRAAIQKFQDHNIRDDIARNARNVTRKLAPNDRLIAPARLIAERGGSIDALAEVMAAALLYNGPDEAALQARLKTDPIEEVFADISQCAKSSPLIGKVALHYARLRKARNREN